MPPGNSDRFFFRLMSMLTGLVVLLTACGGPKGPDYHLVNFAFLNRLCRPLPGTAAPMLYVHHQADAQGTPAPAAPHGIGRLDDAARALLVYLRWQELTGDSAFAGRCDSLLHFILFMQADDGRWYRWLREDGSRGGEGDIENPGIGNGAGRAVWALGKWVEDRARNSRTDGEVTAAVRNALERSLAALQRDLQRYPKMEEVGEVQVPLWLPNGANADVAAELLLGFVAFRRAGGEMPGLNEAIDRLTAGIAMMQQRQEGAFAYGAHFSYKNVWHGWGNDQVQALVEVHRMNGRPEPLHSARREADSFYPWLLKEQFADHFRWPDARDDRYAIEYFPQRPEHVRPVVMGSLALYDLTGEKKYAKMAGQAARWLLGDNAAHEAVYDPATGAAHAWIKARNRVRPEITADAVTEALWILIEVGRVPIAQKELLR